jgi:8-oxo-dGTP diphosphatase
MPQSPWDQVEEFFELSSVTKQTAAHFRKLKSSQSTYTQSEGNSHHYCTFFLPVHRDSHSVYLGYHKKAADWIPPGGHIEPGELPSDTAIREMQEELGYKPQRAQLTPHTLSIKYLNKKPGYNCLTHYDIWYLVEMPARVKFEFLTKEYHDARWFGVKQAVKHIQHNPDFAQIVSRVLS